MNLRILKKEADPKSNDLTRVLFLLPSEGEPTAEDMAMLQALYSRDPRPIDASVKMLKTSKSGDFMNKFYVGYGHDSIAELGDVVVAIENVPMPVAKLIQHYQLYRGQECSTRYIDFSNQPFVAQTPAGKVFQEKLRAFYLKALEPTTNELVSKFQLDASVPTELKAAKAAAFDVLRGFLPTGATTNLAWTTDLRNLNNRVKALREYVTEYPELGVVLDKIKELALEAFPNSINDKYQATNPLEWPFEGSVDSTFHDVSYHPLRFVNGEPRGTVEWMGLIDFASWRDLARHRSVYQTFPAISTKYGFEWWYIDVLPIDLRGEANELIFEAETINDVYAIPMGFQVPFVISGPLDKFKYLIKLRSGPTVHPTLRNRIYELAITLSAKYGLQTVKMNRPQWVVGGRRGKQDITLKGEDQ